MNNEFENDENDQKYEEAKLIETMMVLHKHFAQYIKEFDPELFARAVDYAKTFTEHDVKGVSLKYVKDENKNDSE